MDVVVEIAGWSAAIVMLVAYGMLSRGKVNGQATSYQSLNVVGSALVGLNSFAHGAWPSASINFVWLLIGVVTLAAAVRRHHRAQVALLHGAEPIEHDAAGTAA